MSNIETKQVRDSVFDYQNFGWVYSEDVHKGHHMEHVLIRDKNMNNYSQIVALENKYFNLKSQLRTYKKINGLALLIALLFFAVPGILYAIFKSIQKKNINKHNTNIKNQMNAIALKANKLK